MNRKIVVLDTAPTDAGDMDWSEFEALGELKRYERTDPADVAERIGDAEIVLTNKTPIAASVFEQCPSLSLVCELATGYDNIAIEAAKAAGVTVCNVPGYSTASTAQLAINLLLQLAYRTGAHNTAFHAGEWAQSSTFSFWKHPLVELDGKTLMIVGLGSIGSRTAAIAEAIGMRVVAAQLPGRPAGSGAYPRVPLDEGVATADAISLHCPLTAETDELFDAERISKMKPDALLVNMGRGPLVDSRAIADALRNGTIAGYATDVLEAEPPSADHPLMNVPNCIVTPHIGWASREARSRLLAATAANIRAFDGGTPQNVVAEP